MLQRGNSGDGCDLASTFCKYDMRKGDLFVLSWVRQVKWGSISSQLLMYGGGVHSILLLPLVARCLKTIYVCIWRRFCMSVVVTCVGVCGFLSFGVLKYVVCLYRGCDGCCVLCLHCEAWSCRCSCMGSVSVSSCICCMFVSCVHHVAVLNAVFCMTCSLLMLVEDAIDDHMEEASFRFQRSQPTRGGTVWQLSTTTDASKSRSTPILTVRCSFQRGFCLGSVRCG